MSKLNALKDRIIRFKNDVQEQLNQRSAQRFAVQVSETREPSPFKSTGINDSDDMVPIAFGSQRFANAIGYGPTVDQLNQFHARSAQRTCNHDDCADLRNMCERAPRYDDAA